VDRKAGKLKDIVVSQDGCTVTTNSEAIKFTVIGLEIIFTGKMWHSLSADVNKWVNQVTSDFVQFEKE
jgi:hypothetical protein